MKRLSLDNLNNKTYRLSIIPDTLLYTNDGSYITNNGTKSNGVCILCEQRFCQNYSKEEYQASLFKSFPHNSSYRVCPTNAITIDQTNSCAIINNDLCFGCGLCIHRCPTAAISIDFNDLKCHVNPSSTYKEECTVSEQNDYLLQLKNKHIVKYNIIPESFSSIYQSTIFRHSKKIPDICEIIVRNTLINMGIQCYATAAGNNHIRIEFFGQQNSKIIIGESNSSDTDTLTVLRRILDDEAVMISRYNQNKSDIIPLAVLNGLPNRRTDYYEVIDDIKNVLDIQINTVTFHILFLFSLFNLELKAEDLKSFIINKECQDLIPALEKFIPNISTIDKGALSISYKPGK